MNNSYNPIWAESGQDGGARRKKQKFDHYFRYRRERHDIIIKTLKTIYTALN